MRQRTSGVWSGTLAVLGVAASAMGDVRDFVASYSSPTGSTQSISHRIYVPPAADVPRLKGVIFLYPGTGGDYRNLANDPVYQEAARSMGMALVGSVSFDSVPGAGADAVMQTILDEAARTTGRAELANAPIVAAGFSQGANAAFGWAYKIPQRTIAAVGNKGGYPYNNVASWTGTPAEEAARTHTLMIAGSADANAMTRPTVLDPYFETNRAADNGTGRAAFAVDWRIGHARLGGQAVAVEWAYIAESMKTRYPTDAFPSIEPGERLALNTVPIQNGWLAERPDVLADGTITRSPFGQIAPYNAYVGDKLNAAWLPTETMARVYQAYTSFDGVTTRSAGSLPVMPVQGPLAIVGDAAPRSVSGSVETPQMAVWTTGSTIQFTVDPRDFDDTHAIQRVDFYDGDTLVGSLTAPGPGGWSIPHTLTTRGIHSLTAVATDVTGRQTAAFRTVVVTPPRVTGVRQWRFERSPGLTTDHYDFSHLTPQGASDGPTAVALGATGPGSAFPKQIGAGPFNTNDYAAFFSAAAAQAFTSADATSLPSGTTPFTIEGFIHLASLAEAGGRRVIAGHGGGSAGDMGWQLAVDPAGQLVFEFTANGQAASAERIGSDLTLTPGVDYYVAFRLNPADTSAAGAAFFVQDLTHGGPLMEIERSHTLTSLWNSSLPFTLGAGHQSGYWDGLIDDLRLTNQALPRTSLLISQVPEPGTLLPTFGAVSLLLRRRRYT